jgi:tetratricopeptide (TPR) repeat protein
MPICTERELPEKARALWQKAKSAAELKNHGYAISLIQTLLRECPGFLDGRKVLRSAAIAQNGTRKGSRASGLFGSLSTSAFRGGASVRKDPLLAMEQAEKTLESDPYNPAGNHLLKEAAMAAGFPEIALFALETLSKGNPRDTKVLHELGEMYLSADHPDKALEVFNRIAQINPGDLTAIKRAKDTAATATMKKGGWETAKSYRDLIKDKDEAVLLEQKSRTFKDLATIDAQLGDLSREYEAQPQNVDVVRRICQLMELKYEQTKNPEDLAGTVQWYAYCDQLISHSDPAIARKVSDLQSKQLEVSIQALEEWFGAGGDAHPDADQYREQLAGLKAQRAESVIGEARKRVDRNPTDLQLRFELGERMVEAGQFNEAIPELQRARQNPNVRLRAMSMLGRCYEEKNMLDLAVQQFKTAASEMVAMDVFKKETLYRLALLHERMGAKTEYLEALKEIYEADYGFRDVAQRVESSYAGG